MRSPAPLAPPRLGCRSFPAFALTIVRSARGSHPDLIEPSRAAVMHRSVKTRAQRDAARTPASCRSRTRARECVGTGSRPDAWLSGFALARLLTRRPTAIPLAVRSAPSPCDVTRDGAADELGHLPLTGRSPFPVSRKRAEPSGTRGARPSGDPGPFDRRLQLTILFSRNACSSSRCTPRRVFPTRRGNARFTPSRSLQRASRTLGALSSPIAPAARTSDAPSLRGLPGRARLRPPASARRSSCDDPRVVPESLGFLRQAA